MAEEARRLSIVETFSDGTVNVVEGAEAAGEGKDESQPTGTFQNMLKWDPDYKGFTSPYSIGHKIGPPGWQNRNQSPFGDGAWVIPEHSKIEKTLGSEILYVWGFNADGVRVYMKMPQDGRAVDGSKVERFMGTG